MTWSATGHQETSVDSFLGLLRSLVRVIDNYEIDRLYSNMIRDLDFESGRYDGCLGGPTCGLNQSLYKVHETFSPEVDAGRAQDVVSVFLNKYLRDYEKYSLSPLPSGAEDLQSLKLAAAALYVSLLHVSWREFQEAQRILEAILRLTNAPGYEFDLTRRVVMAHLALCLVHHEQDNDAAVLVQQALSIPTGCNFLDIIADCNCCVRCSRKLLKAKAPSFNDFPGKGELQDYQDCFLKDCKIPLAIRIPDAEAQLPRNYRRFRTLELMIHITVASVASELLEQRRKGAEQGRRSPVQCHCSRTRYVSDGASFMKPFVFHR